MRGEELSVPLARSASVARAALHPTREAKIMKENRKAVTVMASHVIKLTIQGDGASYVINATEVAVCGRRHARTAR
jgi:hypothetical protein